MTTKTPLATVNEKFGDKAQLVAAVEKLAGEELWVSRTNEAKGLAHVSNSKLLRLHATFTEVKQKFGTREKLIDAILELERRAKDTGLRQRLSAWPVPRLYDAYRSAAKRASTGPTGRSDGAQAGPRTAKAVGALAPSPKAASPKPAAKKSVAAKSSTAKPSKKTVKKSPSSKG